MNFLRNKKALVVAGGAAMILLLMVILSSLGGRLGGSVTVEIIVVPTDATLTIDGEPTTPGTVSLNPGQHTLRATREFFGDAVKEIDTESLDTSQPIYLTLDSNTPEAERYMIDNPDEQLLRERAFGQEFSNTSQSILERYPVTKDLPYTTVDYRIDYEVTESKDVRFIVTLYPVATQPGSDLYKRQLNQFKQSALNYLSDKGVDIDTADIVFSPDPDD
jgi:hypothetical protein